jgi:hypothetical protein
MAPQKRLHVDPRSEDALCGDRRLSVQQVVEDLEAEVRLADLIDIREGEGYADGDTIALALGVGAALAAEVAARLLGEGQ